MKSEVIKLPSSEPTFPCIAQDNTSGAIVLFRKPNEFTCLVTNENFCFDDEDEQTQVGDHCKASSSILNKDHWTIIPKITIKFKM